MKRVTIKDVAERAGVSFGTVSRALADHPEISQATKERIRKISEEMGYVSNNAARGLVKKNTQTIGLIVSDISNPYFSEIALSVEMAAREQGYRVILCNTLRSPERDLDALEQMLRQQVDGIIVALSAAEGIETFQRTLGSTPAVFLGNNHSGACSYVSVDNYKIGYIGGRYLAQLGHREIAFLGPRGDSATSHIRIRGFLDAVGEIGAHGYTYMCPPELADRGRYYELAVRFFEGGHRPSAIFAYSDRFALGVLQAAPEFRIAVPEDISLIGADNISYCGLPRINLTTLSPHKRTIGRIATDRLIQKIKGDAREYHDVLEPELIIRGSCRNVSR